MPRLIIFIMSCVALFICCKNSKELKNISSESVIPQISADNNQAQIATTKINNVKFDKVKVTYKNELLPSNKHTYYVLKYGTVDIYYSNESFYKNYPDCAINEDNYEEYYNILMDNNRNDLITKKTPYGIMTDFKQVNDVYYYDGIITSRFTSDTPGISRILYTLKDKYILCIVFYSNINQSENIHESLSDYFEYTNNMYLLNKNIDTLAYNIKTMNTHVDELDQWYKESNDFLSEVRLSSSE